MAERGLNLAGQLCMPFSTTSMRRIANTRNNRQLSIHRYIFEADRWSTLSFRCILPISGRYSGDGKGSQQDLSFSSRAFWLLILTSSHSGCDVFLHAAEWRAPLFPFLFCCCRWLPTSRYKPSLMERDDIGYERNVCLCVYWRMDTLIFCF
ncbi:hypothetical protein CONLIGDRAFT_205388 [Coniochaeta ligniaria NRRL 30616]|uniref:Uncharacterized protein n=1 Tax=Coniochaeta ligniaria NRRL 30616 TaxID=1408157 RepID=A0A1J7J2L3_9PEZI|nr:hypothetical protein CONLIGDRAFT_205388 [Coniochaeta ligniaria NRRL 30616]